MDLRGPKKVKFIDLEPQQRLIPQTPWLVGVQACSQNVLQKLAARRDENVATSLT